MESHDIYECQDLSMLGAKRMKKAEQGSGDHRSALLSKPSRLQLQLLTLGGKRKVATEEEELHLSVYLKYAPLNPPSAPF